MMWTFITSLTVPITGLFEIVSHKTLIKKAPD